MQFSVETYIYGIKESKGDFEGKAFSSTTFYLDVDLAENGAGRSLGSASKPFKCGDASEFEKWLSFETLLKAGPLKANAVFQMEATKSDVPSLKLVSIKPAVAPKPAV